MAQLSLWLQAQQSLIGSLLIDPDFCAGEIFQRCVPGMFGDKSMQHLFEAARDLWNNGRPIDPVTVKAKAGEEYHELIAACMTATPTAANAVAYAEILQKEAKLAALQTKASAILSAKNVEDALIAYEDMGKMLGDAEPDDGMSLSEMISAYLDRMNDPTPPDYLRFGFDSLDRALAISPGTFVVIGADSSTGKTALALQFAVHIAMQGKRVGFFSLETPETPLQNRLMAELQLAGISMPASQHKKLSDEDLRRVVETGIRHAETQLRFFRKADTLEKIRAKTLRHRFEVIFIDYVQLINCPGEDRWQVVTQVSMGLHRLAQELGVTIVGLCQVTVEKERRRRTLTIDDLRESKQLKQDAEVILLLNWSNDKDEDGNIDESLRILDVGKNKDGWKPSIKLKFDAEHMTFAPLITMDTIRAEGQQIRNEQAASAARRRKKDLADHIPKDLKPGEFAPLPEDDELPL